MYNRYFEDMMETITLAESVIYESQLMLNTIHPKNLMIDKDNVLSEAAANNDKIEKAIRSIIIAIENVAKKFTTTIKALKTQNAEWLVEAEAFDISKYNWSKLNFTMREYDKGIENINNTQIPKFNDSDIKSLTKDDGKSFKKKYFKNLFDFSDEAAPLVLDYFRGNEVDFTVSGARGPELYKLYLNFLTTDYEIMAKSTAKELLNIKKILETAINRATITESGISVINESALLSRSIYKDEYFDILLEAVAPDDVRKDVDAKIEVDATKNKEVKMSNEAVDAMRIYAKICNSVITGKMKVLEEIYSVAIKFVEKVMK